MGVTRLNRRDAAGDSVVCHAPGAEAPRLTWVVQLEPVASFLREDHFGSETWQATLPLRKDACFVRLGATMLTGP